MYLSNKDLKLVTVRPARPFRLKAANFTSLVRNIILSCESIAYCLQEKALVTENLANGKQVPLDFANYNTDNGPSAVPEGASEFIVNPVDQAITVTDLDGNKTVINNRVVVARAKLALCHRRVGSANLFQKLERTVSVPLHKSDAQRVGIMRDDAIILSLQ